MQVVRVSGTIKKAEEEAIRRARISIRRAQKVDARSKGKDLVAGAGFTGPDEDRDDDVEMNFANGIEDLDEPGDMDESD